MSDLVLLEGEDPSMREIVERRVGAALPWAASGQEKSATVWFCPGRPPAKPRELPALRWIHSGWAGIEDWFERPEWRGAVHLTRTVGDFPQRIAEYVIGWLLADSLDVPEALRQMEARAWRRWTSQSLFARALLVVGYGAIGRRVAEAARGIGMHATGVRRGPVTPEERALGVESADALGTQLGSADVVVNLLPLTKETVRFWNADRFRRMKPGSIFVNVSRGGTVDEAALIAGLAADRPARAILDVFQEEPLPEAHPLRSSPGVWITPHVAGIGTKEPLAAEFAANWHRYRDGVPLRNVVDRVRGY
ncbi:MAG TPA: D-2-hydroxyacid dehydrogenase [Candidatus Eisenbacteria bacterium]|nr:D-2-hydroxyacid dehydrogenase [Candidatus Eisenbacteria bacterium]